MSSKVTFSWSNYTRPTPRNLEYFASSARRFVAVIAGVTVIMEANKWWPVAVILVGALLDELKNFFAHAAEGAQEEVTITYPKEIADQVDVDIKNKPE